MKITKQEKRRRAERGRLGGKKAAAGMTKSARVERATKAAFVRHHPSEADSDIPECPRCHSKDAIKPVFIGPHPELQPESHSIGDVIDPEPIYSHWCERCDVACGQLIVLPSNPRRPRKKQK
jgi:hypothetical protein